MNTLQEVRKKLKRSKITIEAMAKESGVSKRTIFYIRDTDKDPRFSTVDRLDRYLRSNKYLKHA